MAMWPALSAGVGIDLGFVFLLRQESTEGPESPGPESPAWSWLLDRILLALIIVGVVAGLAAVTAILALSFGSPASQ